MRSLKVMVLSAVFGVCVAGSSYGTIYDYRGIIFFEGLTGIIRWNDGAHLVQTQIGRVTVLIVDRKMKHLQRIDNIPATFKVYNVVGNKGNMLFRARGLLNNGVWGPDEIDVALGTLTTRNGLLSSASLKGAHVDPDVAEYGSTRIRYNRALTLRAQAAGAVTGDDYVRFLVDFYRARGYTGP